MSDNENQEDIVEIKEENVIENSEKPKQGLSIASLVLGIVSIVFFLRETIVIPCAILAIIFGIKGKKNGGKGMAAAGFILGIVSLSLWAIVILFIAIVIGGSMALLTGI